MSAIYLKSFHVRIVYTSTGTRFWLIAVIVFDVSKFYLYFENETPIFSKFYRSFESMIHVMSKSAKYKEVFTTHT